MDHKCHFCEKEVLPGHGFVSPNFSLCYIHASILQNDLNHVLETQAPTDEEQNEAIKHFMKLAGKSLLTEKEILKIIYEN